MSAENKYVDAVHGTDKNNSLTSFTSKARVKKLKFRYKLADLVAKCDPTAPIPSDMHAWNKASPAGMEII